MRIKRLNDSYPTPVGISGLNQYQIDGHKFTPPIEINIILNLIAEFAPHGNFMELGCNEGYVSAAVCKNFQSKIVYGVDYDKAQMDTGQMPEHPGSKMFGVVNKYTNFHGINCDSSKIKINGMNITSVFIDADHRYAAVKKDTENIMRQMKKGLIIWHDYTNDMHNYMGVTRYLNELSEYYPINWIFGTLLCYLKL